MDPDTMWGHVHHERAALAGVLRDLTPQEWETPSLCAGWTVRDVAAHVISTPAIGVRDTLRMGPSFLLGYNRAIFRETKRRGRAPVEMILADFERYAGSRHHVPVTTRVEPLIDVLVHTQDVVRPLGRRHAMPPDAAAVAADRARLLSPLTGSRRVVRSVRMRATDVAWERGRGPEVAGPVEELLLLCTGRTPEWDRLSGSGVELLARREATAPGRRTGS